MSNLLSDLRPPYPVYASQPMFGGRLPTIDELGPPDVRPTSLINPSYSLYQGAWGRNIAGLGADMTTPTADEGIRDYPNELNVLAAADDVQGNGVFDPPGSHGNVYPDQGIFSDHESLPGYIVRDKFYQPSQVIDGTTGEPIMFVPAGAVAIDQAQRDAIRRRQLLYEVPPEVSPQPALEMPAEQSIVTPQEWAYPVSGLGMDGEPATRAQIVTGLVIAGIAVGLFAATVMPKRKR